MQITYAVDIGSTRAPNSSPVPGSQKCDATDTVLTCETREVIETRIRLRNRAAIAMEVEGIVAPRDKDLELLETL